MHTYVYLSKYVRVSRMARFLWTRTGNSKSREELLQSRRKLLISAGLIEGAEDAVSDFTCPAISCGRALTTATLEELCAQQSAPALVTSNSSDAHSFAWAARGCASGPARRMLGRADEHGWGTRDAGRWPWRASAGVIKRSRAGLSTVRNLFAESRS